MASPGSVEVGEKTTPRLKTLAGEGSSQQLLGETANRRERALMEAIINGKAHKVQTLLESNDMDVDCRDSSLQQTPLIKACSTPQKNDLRTHLVRMLLSKGANVNVQDRSGKTALMHCCRAAEHQDALRLLVRNRNLDPNMQDENGNTALLLCVRHSNLGGIRILLQSSQTKDRIHVDRRNIDGVSPLVLASKLADKECCQILLEAGASTSDLPSHMSHLLPGSPDRAQDGGGPASSLVGYLTRRKQMLSPLPSYGLDRRPVQTTEEMVSIESPSGKKRTTRGKKKKSRGQKSREGVRQTHEGYLPRPDPFNQDSRLPQITNQKNLTGNSSGIF